MTGMINCHVDVHPMGTSMDIHRYVIFSPGKAIRKCLIHEWYGLTARKNMEKADKIGYYYADWSKFSDLSAFEPVYNDL
ncbi:MAG: hypothetical protein LUE29_06685 [Lachnospiraceae bacterium]|nr:hypothetical protein [Lachnospiraceae bacterium]